MRSCLIFVLLALFLCGCTPPLGPKSLGVCLESSRSKTDANQIRSLLLEQATILDLHVRDHSDEFRRLERNEELVFMRLRDHWMLPSFRIEFRINPTFGRSRVTLYSSDEKPPAELSTLVKALEDDFQYVTSAENSVGGCGSEHHAGDNE